MTLARIALATALLNLLAACQMGPPPRAARNDIDAAIADAVRQRPQPQVPEKVAAALLPPLTTELPRPARAPEPRFDLAVNNASLQQVFHAIASGSRYSILLPPGLSGTVSINLKDVTVREALDVLRELHGLEYRIEGTRVFIQPATLQTRMFQVSYPTAKRLGRSETRVTSGSIASQSGANAANGGNASAGAGLGSAEGSQVSTSTDSDFWKELDASLKAVVGTDAGRQVVISQHTGVIIVKGYAKDMREVENFLRSARLSVERQVMLEAKIVEVSLREGFESGINWALLSQGNHRVSVGANANAINVPGSIGRQYGIESGSINTPVEAGPPPTITPNVLGNVLTNPFASGTGVLGLAFTTNTFNGLLAFLETQGTVQVLSSPRVAAINNQKAVLRVGTDDFFITNISTTTTSSAAGNVTTPTITVQPFFSGISLDVTPQIDDEGMVTMHVRPSVSEVKERSRIVNLGTAGAFTLPLASSNVNETDTIVRVQDGSIVAIGGLMQQSQSDDKSQVPGAGEVPVAGHLFKRTNRSLTKRELVFLIKPTVIKGDAQWTADLSATQERIGQVPSQPR
jgi:MSHA biogenesis protein MshL